jgi:hypothetical protein
MVVTSREKLSLCQQKNKQTKQSNKASTPQNKQRSLEERCECPKKTGIKDRAPSNLKGTQSISLHIKEEKHDEHRSKAHTQ